MRTFTDSQGRTWCVAINVGVLKRVKAAVGVDLLDLLGEELLKRLQADIALLVDIVYVVCREEAEKRSITDEQFGAALVGDAISGAWDALSRSVADFFPSPRREMLHRALDRLAGLGERAAKATMARLNSDELDRQLERMLGGSSGAAPAPPGSTPTP